MVTVFINSNREFQSAQRIRSFDHIGFAIILDNYNFQNVRTVVCLML